MQAALKQLEELRAAVARASALDAPDAPDAPNTRGTPGTPNTFAPAEDAVAQNAGPSYPAPGDAGPLLATASRSQPQESPSPESRPQRRQTEKSGSKSPTRPSVEKFASLTPDMLVREQTPVITRPDVIDYSGLRAAYAAPTRIAVTFRMETSEFQRLRKGAEKFGVKPRDVVHKAIRNCLDAYGVSAPKGADVLKPPMASACRRARIRVRT
ncbi:MAG: hypothetical protein AAFQ96_06790 [Pseudomonadota bacterium]